MATEYLAKGILRTFLRSRRLIQLRRQQSNKEGDRPLTSSNLLQFGVDVAKGMEHLSKSGVGTFVFINSIQVNIFCILLFSRHSTKHDIDIKQNNFRTEDGGKVNTNETTFIKNKTLRRYIKAKQ